MPYGIRKGWKKASVAAYAFLVAAALALIWGHRFLPMQDYPIWLSEGDILSRLLAGAPDGNFGIVPYPVPNAVSTAIIGLLGVMMNVEIAGKVFLSLAVIVFALGAYWLTAPPPGLRRNAFSLMPLALMPGYPFFHGNINYFLGLGLFMLGAGYLIRRADGGRSVRPWPLLAQEVVVSRDGLLIRLRLHGLNSLVAELEGEVQPQPGKDGQTPDIRVPAEFKVRGGRKKVILPADAEAKPKAQPNPPLVLALAHALKWQRMLDDRVVEGVEALAAQHRMDRTCVSRILGLATLAPQFVEAAVMGNEPSGLSMRKLLNTRLPIRWDEQRAVLGSQ
jgi:hypothetical protein